MFTARKLFLTAEQEMFTAEKRFLAAEQSSCADESNGEDAEYRGGERLSPPRKTTKHKLAMFFCVDAAWYDRRVLRRAARIFLNALTIASLLLCLAAAGSWVRAEVYADEHADQISYHTGLALHVLSLTPVGVDYYHRWDDLDHPVLRTGSNPLPWTRGWWYSRLYVGGGGNHFSFYRDDETFDVGLPYWSLVLAGACLPSMWMVGWRRRRSRMTRPGHYCPSCGYDLRATPDRCPECGTAVVSTVGPPSEGLSETEGV